jgi:hypothetical protein
MEFFNKIIMSVCLLTHVWQSVFARREVDLETTWNDFATTATDSSTESKESKESEGFFEKIKRTVGLEKLTSKRMEKFNETGLANYTKGGFFKTKDGLFVKMVNSTDLFIDPAVDVKTKKLNVLFMYRDFYNTLMMPRGQEMLLEKLNNWRDLDMRLIYDVRQYMNDLIGKAAGEVLETGSATGLDKMRTELLRKYFDVSLVESLHNYLSEQIEKIAQPLEREYRENEEDFNDRMDKPRRDLSQGMQSRMKPLEGVNTGILRDGDYYGEAERGLFTIAEIESLKREMERIESIPFSYATMLKHTMKVAAATATAGAIGYGAYQYYQGNLDSTIDTTREFVTKTLPTAFSLSNLTKQASSIFDRGVNWIMPSLRNSISFSMPNVIEPVAQVAQEVPNAIVAGSKVASSAFNEPASFFEGGGWDNLGSQVGQAVRAVGSAVARGTERLGNSGGSF